MDKGFNMMSNDPVADLLGGERQLSFDFVGERGHGVEYLGETRQGFGLYRRKEGHGGYSYWTDEIPPAVFAYDEGISNIMSTFEALDHLGQGEAFWVAIGESFGYNKKK